MRKLFFTLSVMPFVILVGCGQQSNSVPQAIVKQIQFTVQIPKASDVKSLSIASDGAGSIWMVPTNATATIIGVLDWLKNAKPVSVQFPQLKTTHRGFSGEYTGPATLFLNLKNQGQIRLIPAFYVWSNSNGEYDYHYLDGVIQYQFDNKTAYFQSPPLYKWLKDDQWKTGFKNKTS